MTVSAIFRELVQAPQPEQDIAAEAADERIILHDASSSRTSS